MRRSAADGAGGFELEEGGEAEVPRLQSTPPPAPRHDSCLPPSGPQDARRLLPARTHLSVSQTRPSLFTPAPTWTPPALFLPPRTQEAGFLPSDPPGRPSRVAGVGGGLHLQIRTRVPRAALGPGAPFRRLSLSPSHTHITRSSPIGGVPGQPPTPTRGPPPSHRGPGRGTTLGADVRPGGRGALGRRPLRLSRLPFSQPVLIFFFFLGCGFPRLRTHSSEPTSRCGPL